ncbi:unnamed protein product [Rotaria sp. Silwood1]|nr:unnamed protein product [Rotaria sp. Silwood1]CAF4946122.1 unnamed protein product [Rotaria sp. Silwood1]
MLDASLDYIQTIRDRPVWRPIPEDVRAILEDASLPEGSRSLIDVCHDVLTYILPYPRGNTHPRYWGWVKNEGTVGGVLADMITSAINPNSSGGFFHSGYLLERAVIDWMRQVFGFPKMKNGGLLVSGTSMATIMSIATARRRAIVNIREVGLANGPQLIAYASTEVHGCVIKALELLGLGSKALHLIPTDDNFRIKIDELKVAIRDDRDKGLVPFCIIGNAGTVNTGAFDDLLELSSIARAENIWLHVDGAFGSSIILDPQRRRLVAGIDQADSLAFDFHKWFHCPYDAGCVLIRDNADLHLTFSMEQSILAIVRKDLTNDALPFAQLSPELSRSCRARKVWFTLQEHGTIKLGKKIADNCEQAQYLASLLGKYEYIIRIIRPITLNVVNFRFEPDALDKADHELIDMFNTNLADDMQRSGIVYPSTSRIRNRLYIRVCIVSHRSTREDVDIFVETTMKLYQIRLGISQQQDSKT